MRKRRNRLDWLWGTAMTAALFVCLYLVSNFRYENSDDALILKAFMGFEGGEPTSFTLYTHTLLTWLLYGLGRLAPTVAWFSLFQLALLFGSGVVLVRCMFRLARGRRRPRLSGGLAGALTLAVFAAFACCRVNYNTTAALAGAAAVAQALVAGNDGEPGGFHVRAWLPCLFLLACAYLLRAASVLPPLVFTGIAFVWRLAGRGNGKSKPAANIRPALATLAVFAAVFVALAGIRLAETALRGQQDFLKWHQARTALMDYTDFEADPAPALRADGGLSAPQVEMVRQWYFMDAAVDTRALTAMADAYGKNTAADAVNRLVSFFTEHPRYALAAGILMLLCGLCWLGARKTAPLAATAATVAVAGALAMLVYLCWRGRLIERAADAVLMPCAVLLFGLALLKAPEPGVGSGRRALALALSLLLAGAAALNARLTYHAVTRAPDTVSQQRESDLEAFALTNPDVLIVRSPNLLRDTRLFPDVSAGVPANILLWGDWGCRTPNWYSQLSRYGFAGETFSAKDWLKDGIVLAASSEADTEALAAYLADALGTPVTAEPYGTGGTLTFYRFRI